MLNTKGNEIVGFSLNEVLVFGMVGMQFVTERSIVAPRKATFFVDQCDQIHRFAGDQVENALVIFEGNMAPVDTLIVVFLLLELEDMVNEKLLQVFVRIVNAQLFEAVALEVFKTEDIQYSQTTKKKHRSETPPACPIEGYLLVIVKYALHFTPMKEKHIQYLSRISYLYGDCQ